MRLLKDYILTQGDVFSNNILKVDAFLNHQVNPNLMKEIGKEFAERYKQDDINKILTIESSGIGPALFTAYFMDLDMIFARKKKSLTMDEQVHYAQVYSYTKQEFSHLIVSKDLLSEGDRVLVIDDFLANGEAAKSMAELTSQAKAELVGFGIVIEKSFQSGREKLEQLGYRVESLAKIKSLQNDQVTFQD